MRNVLLLYIIGLLPLSCVAQSQDGITVFCLVNKLNKTEISLKDCPSFALAEVTEINDVPLDAPRLFFVDDSIYGIKSSKSIYLVDRRTGRLDTDFTHIGRGPSEYLYPWTVSVSGDVVSICDNPGVGKLLSYTLDGDYLDTEIIPKDCSYYSIPHDGRVLAYSNHSDRGIEVYDHGTIIHSLDISDEPRSTANTFFPSVCEYDGDLFVRPFFSDICYKVNRNGIIPFIRLEKGKKKMPLDLYATVESYGEGRGDFITSEYMYLCGDYAFVGFDHHNLLYKEIWRISDSKLLYRAVEGKKPEPQGIPVEINGKTLAFWPQYCHGNDLYSVIEDGDVSYVVQLKISD